MIARRSHHEARLQQELDLGDLCVAMILQVLNIVPEGCHDEVSQRVT